MRHPLLIVIFISLFTKVSSQEFIGGLTADYNSGIGERYTYGLGFHFEARLTRCENLYLNWHYAIGSNTHSEFYAHAGLSLLLYRSDDWWDTHVESWEEFVGLVIGPAICPIGLTYYVPNRRTENYRLGIYLNPLAMDYWDMSPRKVTSWTIESGAKFLWYMSNERALYISAGACFTNNIRRGARGFGNETLIGIQVGLLGYN